MPATTEVNYENTRKIISCNGCHLIACKNGMIWFISIRRNEESFKVCMLFSILQVMVL